MPQVTRWGGQGIMQAESTAWPGVHAFLEFVGGVLRVLGLRTI